MGNRLSASAAAIANRTELTDSDQPATASEEVAMNAHLKLTKAGANLIQHFEGCLKKDGRPLQAYKCPANVLTIGWGHTNHHGEKVRCSFSMDLGGMRRSISGGYGRL